MRSITIGVVFDEDHARPAGRYRAWRRHQPSAYVLVSSGPDGDLDTVDCSGVLGDDVALTLASVNYSEATMTATLALPFLRNSNTTSTV